MPWDLPQLGVDCSFLSSLSAWPTFASPRPSRNVTEACQIASQENKHFRAESCRFQSLPPLPCCSRWYYHSTAPRAADSRHPQQALMVFHCQLWPGAGCVGSRRLWAGTNDATGATGFSRVGTCGMHHIVLWLVRCWTTSLISKLDCKQMRSIYYYEIAIMSSKRSGILGCSRMFAAMVVQWVITYLRMGSIGGITHWFLSFSLLTNPIKPILFSIPRSVGSKGW